MAKLSKLTQKYFQVHEAEVAATHDLRAEIAQKEAELAALKAELEQQAAPYTTHKAAIELKMLQELVRRGKGFKSRKLPLEVVFVNGYVRENLPIDKVRGLLVDHPEWNLEKFMTRKEVAPRVQVEIH